MLNLNLKNLPITIQKHFYNHWQIGNFVKKQYNFNSGKNIYFLVRSE
ncbi:hypothetical protein CCAN12_640023 [Capnocytophaga canimorsus]|uniref:Uncharacterized protein n=1 Tax=Capnocytophaga canimorsus TaxID=28188 RepID=A0A0B7HBT2_9FLAO|nr:hypothetical protein CCAN12_640023 [Capnocytophaga canimorsus]